MDETEAKPSQESKDVPPMMKEMMEKMCCSGEFSPADMCRRMMGSMRRTSGAKAPSTREDVTTSDEGGGGEDEGSRTCCGPQSRCAPKRP